MQTAIAYFRGGLGDAGTRMLRDVGATDLFVGQQARALSEEAQGRGHPGFTPDPSLPLEFRRGEARVYHVPR
jgi:hypothetical protein